MLWGLLEYLSSILFFFLHITSAGSFPKALTAAEEKKYLEQMAAGDHHARQKLIEHNLRLVAHIAKKYYADENDRDDLVSIGTVGLIKAVDSFDPTKGIRLSSYASRCIENEILMFFRSAKKTAQDVSLNDAVKTRLSPREREIILLRYGLTGQRPLVQREVAKKLNISRSYVSRLEKKALQKLRKAFDE